MAIRYPVSNCSEYIKLDDALKKTFSSWRCVPRKIAVLYPEKIRMAVQTLHWKCKSSDASQAEHYNWKGIRLCKEWEDNPLRFYQWCYQRHLDDELAYLHIKDTTDGSFVSPDNMEVLYSYKPFNDGSNSRSYDEEALEDLAFRGYEYSQL